MFARTETALVPSALNIHKPSRFNVGSIYELVYEGKDPIVMGLGYVVIRDLIGFFKYDNAESMGCPTPQAIGTQLKRLTAGAVRKLGGPSAMVCI